MCKNQSEENKAKYQNIKNRTKKVLANSMRKEAETEITKLNKKLNNNFTLVKFLKKNGKDIEEGGCMRRKDGRLGFHKKYRKRICKNPMEEIMNEENDLDHVTAASMVEGYLKCCREEMAITIEVMKPAKVAGPSKLSLKYVQR